MESNWLAWLILTALIITFLVETVAELFNLSTLTPEPPPGLADVYPPEEYARSQRYTKAKTRFGLLTGAFDLAITVAFWLAGGFAWLDLWVRGLNLGQVVSGLTYLGSLLLVRTLVSLPFSIYATFWLEERYGFNRTTIGTFIADLGKGLLLAVILGGPLLAGVLFLFNRAGAGAWLYAWAMTSLFVVLMQFIAPAWIMPLFNTFTPLAEGELRERILAYARSVGFALDNVLVIDGSKRSNKSNAFFTGFGSHKRVALYDTLIEGHGVDELVGVLAHEIGHYQKRHIIKGMALGILHLGVMLYLLSLALTSQGLFSAFGLTHPSTYVGLAIFGLLVSPLELILAVLMNAISRRHEFEADRFAADTLGNGQPLILALKKLAAHNLANLTPHPFFVFLHSSHPPLQARVEALRHPPLKT